MERLEIGRALDCDISILEGGEHLLFYKLFLLVHFYRLK